MSGDCLAIIQGTIGASLIDARVDDRLRSIAAAIEEKHGGKRGVTAVRERFAGTVKRLASQARAAHYRPLDPAMVECNRVGHGLARLAGMQFDEHGSTRGDYRSTRVLDYVPACESAAAPYCDMGHAGLALVEVTRKRVYAKSGNWYPRETSGRFVVGRNEVGTYFAHAVPMGIGSLKLALDWIWSGCAKAIVRRQGDIAVIRGSGPKMPILPAGHVVRLGPGCIEHATHPAIRLPGHGERVIVAKRAKSRSAAETRD